MLLTQMTAQERRSVTSIATIMSLRMLGLLMVLPLFSLYASQLRGATPLLIGMALGAYGLTQALLQIPFGMLSDHIGRRKIITLGLLFFALGSFIAASSHTIWGILIGRALQGVGAIGSTLMAMMADLTSIEQRTKAMAIAGMTIGISFMLAMIVGPVLAAWINVPGLFFITGILSFIAIFLLFSWVPIPPAPSFHPEAEPTLVSFFKLLKTTLLLQLNAGIFILHIIFSASFIVLPITLHKLLGLQTNQQWFCYLPGVLFAFILSIPLITMAEKKQQVKNFFVGAIFILAISECLLWLFAKYLLILIVSLILFFTAFSLLEAFLPSLVSRTTPPTRKGTALGIYSCSQFLGIFTGGVTGGWLYGQFGLTSVYLFCVILTLIWVIIAVNMKIGGIYHGKR
jgi:MFS family permease